MIIQLEGFISVERVEKEKGKYFGKDYIRFDVY
jgi:hypothetical protein